MENQNIQIYNYEGKEVRIIEKEDGLWWVASELAEITGHKLIKRSIDEILDDDEVAIMNLVDKIGKTNHFQIINESGFYKLMFRSRLPKAKAFTKHVTSVILPTIRKTGGYNVHAPQLAEIAHDKQAFKELTEQKNAINKRLRFLKMRIEENENTVYSSYGRIYYGQLQKQTALPQYQQIEIPYNDAHNLTP